MTYYKWLSTCGWSTVLGQTANTFKTRLNGHNSDVRTGKRRTALCTYMIDQEKKGNTLRNIKWNRIKAVKPKKKGEKICKLCNLEKTLIAIGPPNLLNRRNEILQRCRHKDRLVLSNNFRKYTGRRQTENLVRVASSETFEHVDRPPDEPAEVTANEEPEDQERSLRTGRVVDYRKFF